MRSSVGNKLPKAIMVYGKGLLLLALSGCAQLPIRATTAPVACPVHTDVTTIVAIAPTSTPQASLPQFLGLTGLSSCVSAGLQRVRNRLGMQFPGLEARPPILALADPANMRADANPLLSAAAEAKFEQDQAPQKIKAINFLASLGCGKCFPNTEAALLSAMDDCNESVRFASVSAIRKSSKSNCRTCCNRSYSSENISKKLWGIAFGLDDCGGPLEQSPRVRRMARLALCACGSPFQSSDSQVLSEGPSFEIARE